MPRVSESLGSPGSGRDVARAPRLGEILIDMGFLEPRQLDRALDQQKRTGERLGGILIGAGWISEARLVRALSRQLGIAMCDPVAAPVHERVLALMPRELAWRLRAVPIALKRTDQRDVLCVVTSDPLDPQLAQEVAATLGMGVEVMIAGETEIEVAIAKHYGTGAPSFAGGSGLPPIHLSLPPLGSGSPDVGSVKIVQGTPAADDGPLIDLEELVHEHDDRLDDLGAVALSAELEDSDGLERPWWPAPPVEVTGGMGQPLPAGAGGPSPVIALGSPSTPPPLPSARASASAPSVPSSWGAPAPGVSVPAPRLLDSPGPPRVASEAPRPSARPSESDAGSTPPARAPASASPARAIASAAPARAPASAPPPATTPSPNAAKAPAAGPPRAAAPDATSSAPRAAGAETSPRPSASAEVALRGPAPARAASEASRRDAVADLSISGPPEARTLLGPARDDRSEARTAPPTPAEPAAARAPRGEGALVAEAADAPAARGVPPPARATSEARGGGEAAARAASSAGAGAPVAGRPPRIEGGDQGALDPLDPRRTATRHELPATQLDPVDLRRSLSIPMLVSAGLDLPEATESMADAALDPESLSIPPVWREVSFSGLSAQALPPAAPAEPSWADFFPSMTGSLPVVTEESAREIGTRLREQDLLAPVPIQGLQHGRTVEELGIAPPGAFSREEKSLSIDIDILEIESPIDHPSTADTHLVDHRDPPAAAAVPTAARAPAPPPSPAAPPPSPAAPPPSAAAPPPSPATPPPSPAAPAPTAPAAAAPAAATPPPLRRAAAPPPVALATPSRAAPVELTSEELPIDDVLIEEISAPTTRPGAVSGVDAARRLFIRAATAGDLSGPENAWLIRCLTAVLLDGLDDGRLASIVARLGPPPR